MIQPKTWLGSTKTLSTKDDDDDDDGDEGKEMNALLPRGIIRINLWVNATCTG